MMPGPAFDVAVSPDGYVWWYLDVVSDDGRFSLVLIAFVGSVFSPFYARARQRGPGVDPLQFPAMNVVLYGPGGRAGPKKRWAMTEARPHMLERSATSFTLGDTTLERQGERLVVRFDERAAPFGQALTGTITLTPLHVFGPEVQLDAHGRHRWWPIAPVSRAEVKLTEPAVRFEGAAYHDANMGEEPLEAGFTRWDWSRADLPEHEAVVLYDADRRDGSELRWGHRFTADGQMIPVSPPMTSALKAGGWGVKRATRHDAGDAPKITRTLEDTPFYCRALVSTPLLGGRRTAVHESLDLERFDSGWVRFLLPFRMRRR